MNEIKTVVITGATSGIGLATTRLLVRQGYRVIGIGHSEANCQRAREQVLAENPTGEISYFAGDLMQQREVHRVADELIVYLNAQCQGELWALINNVGGVRSWYTTTEEGYEQQFALNHLAGFLLTYRLWPLLRQAGGRVLMTGSESHRGIKVHWNDIMLRKGYNTLTAYKQSKLCNILFARGLNDRYAAAGLRAYVVDPGLVRTDIGHKQTGGVVRLVWALRRRGGAPPELPAKTYAFLCGEEPAPQGLYYRQCRESGYSRQVTTENADRLFELSERLCGISYADLEGEA